MEIYSGELPHGFRADVIAMLNVYARSLPDDFPTGGAAVNYWSSDRMTDDIDAELSPRFPRPEGRLLYVMETGEQQTIHFDHKYNPMLSFLHEDYQDDATPAEKLVGLDPRLRVTVMQPIDIAISKLSRFSDKDQDDIIKLGELGYFTAEALNQRASDALV